MARLWLFGCLAVGIPCLPRRYEEASSADGGGSGAQVFERSEFLRTPPPASNAACPRSGPTNPARLFFAYFLLAKQKKVSAQSGAQPDLQHQQNLKHQKTRNLNKPHNINKPHSAK
ncbi:MAG: hypothetical protein KBF98_14900 [Rhodoferax sp.]|jgi:hypothetical protein|nr:hypothetical protein [Rhodoferax sp.]MBP9683933.1 hypothetical protein [Rhodoferax sp.]